MNKERRQNPVSGDTVRLRNYIYNSNNLADIQSVDSIQIYRLDREEVTNDNPEGRVLVDNIEVVSVVHDGPGSYYIDVNLLDSKYVIGHYYDVWNITVDIAKPPQTLENIFQVYPELWYSTPIPVVYDFSFFFQPTKMRKGSRQFIRIEIVPNVPRATELARYYENLAIVSDLTVSMEIKCAPCLPQERDLRLIMEDVPVSFREKAYGYVQIDTADMDCGIYDIWFKLALGGNLFVSEKMVFQIFE